MINHSLSPPMVHNVSYIGQKRTQMGAISNIKNKPMEKKQKKEFDPTNREYLVTNIKWDKHGKKVTLPKQIKITIPEDVELTPEDVDWYISDEISNITGFCHKGFFLTPEIWF